MFRWCILLNRFINCIEAVCQDKYSNSPTGEHRPQKNFWSDAERTDRTDTHGREPFLLLQLSSSMREIRHETPCFRAQTIHRRCRRNVKCPIVFVSPGKIRRLFRHLNRAQMVTLCVPHPDAFGACDKEIPMGVNLDAVRYSLMGSARFLTKDSPIA